MTTDAADIIVYAVPGGREYLALVGERWYRWPATARGWQHREGASPTLHETAEEMPPTLGRLALRLSGVGQYGD